MRRQVPSVFGGRDPLPGNTSRSSRTVDLDADGVTFSSRERLNEALQLVDELDIHDLRSLLRTMACRSTEHVDTLLAYKQANLGHLTDKETSLFLQHISQVVHIIYKKYHILTPSEQRQVACSAWLEICKEMDSIVRIAANDDDAITKQIAIFTLTRIGGIIYRALDSELARQVRRRAQMDDAVGQAIGRCFVGVPMAERDYLRRALGGSWFDCLRDFKKLSEEHGMKHTMVDEILLFADQGRLEPLESSKRSSNVSQRYQIHPAIGADLSNPIVVPETNAVAADLTQAIHSGQQIGIPPAENASYSATEDERSISPPVAIYTPTSPQQAADPEYPMHRQRLRSAPRHHEVILDIIKDGRDPRCWRDDRFYGPKYKWCTTKYHKGSCPKAYRTIREEIEAFMTEVKRDTDTKLKHQALSDLIDIVFTLWDASGNSCRLATNVLDPDFVLPGRRCKTIAETIEHCVACFTDQEVTTSAQRLGSAYDDGPNSWVMMLDHVKEIYELSSASEAELVGSVLEKLPEQWQPLRSKSSVFHQPNEMLL